MKPAEAGGIDDELDDDELDDDELDDDELDDDVVASADASTFVFGGIGSVRLLEADCNARTNHSVPGSQATAAAPAGSPFPRES